MLFHVNPTKESILNRGKGHNKTIYYLREKNAIKVCFFFFLLYANQGAIFWTTADRYFST